MRRLNELMPLGLPLLTALLSLPLALRLIGPNRLYGYRTATSLAGPEAWYPANASAGWLGVAFSLAALAINLHLLRSVPGPFERRSVTAVLVFAAAMLLCTGVSIYINE